MRQAWLPVLLVLAVAVAGCTDEPQQGDTGTTGRTNMTAGAGANVTVNQTGNQTGGNATVGAGANATAGNATGNMTGNATSNATGPQELSNGTHDYGVGAPDDAAFEVPRAFRTLAVDAEASGLIADLRVLLVDPGGNETVVLEGAVAAGRLSNAVTVTMPARGTWTLSFEGSGAGSVTVSVRGE